MRTLEFERAMLRATNTGYTAVIDHHGVVTASIAPHTQGVVDGVVEGRRGLTPFARWASHLGLWPLWLLGGALVVASSRGTRL
jgi:apolipoprotein N-acyltransferase